MNSMKKRSDFKEGFTQQVWGLTELAENSHVSRGHLYRLLEQGQMLPPDVLVLPDAPGWRPERATRYNKEVGRLDENGQPAGPVAGDALRQAERLARTTYAVQPDIFLSSGVCSEMFGYQRSTTWFIRNRGHFTAADVRIGQRRYGWSELRVMEVGEQTGRLDDDGADWWAILRTAKYGLSPDDPWVAERASERPHLTQPLKEAAAAYRQAPLALTSEQQARAYPKPGVDRWAILRTTEYGMSPDDDWVQQRVRVNDDPSLANAVEKATAAAEARKSQAEES